MKDIITKKEFQTRVNDIARALKISYTDAVLKVCEEKQLDPQDVGRFIDGALKEHIKKEATILRLLKPSETHDLTKLMK